MELCDAKETTNVSVCLRLPLGGNAFQELAPKHWESAHEQAFAAPFPAQARLAVSSGQNSMGRENHSFLTVLHSVKVLLNIPDEDRGILAPQG